MDYQTVSLIIIGTELTRGIIGDKHGQVISTELSHLGYSVQKIIIVPDDGSIQGVLGDCIGQSDVVLVTGGLGPTSDDMSVSSALSLGTCMVLDQLYGLKLDSQTVIRIAYQSNVSFNDKPCRITDLLAMMNCKKDNLLFYDLSQVKSSGIEFPFSDPDGEYVAVIVDSKISPAAMYVSAVANVINIIGDAVGVFWLHAGVAGVAYPSLLSRMIMAVAVSIYCTGGCGDVRYRWDDVRVWDHGLLGRILSVAIPNGVENGVHQLVKVALSSMHWTQRPSSRVQKRTAEKSCRFFLVASVTAQPKSFWVTKSGRRMEEIQWNCSLCP